MPATTLNSQLMLSITHRHIFAAIIWIATYRYIGSIWKATPIAFLLYKAIRYQDASFVTILTIWYFVYPYVEGIPETVVVTFILFKLIKRAYFAVRKGELWFRANVLYRWKTNANRELRLLGVPELLDHILHELPERELLVAQRVCRQWRQTIQQPRFQRKLFLERNTITPDNALAAILKQITETVSGLEFLAHFFHSGPEMLRAFDDDIHNLAAQHNNIEQPTSPLEPKDIEVNPIILDCFKSFSIWSPSLPMTSQCIFHTTRADLITSDDLQILQFNITIADRHDVREKQPRMVTRGGSMDRMQLCRPSITTQMRVSMADPAARFERVLRLPPGATIGQALHRLQVLAETLVGTSRADNFQSFSDLGGVHNYSSSSTTWSSSRTTFTSSSTSYGSSYGTSFTRNIDW